MFKYFFLIVPCVVFMLTGCNNDQANAEKYIDPEAIYFDYRVWGAEEDNAATVRLQYFAGYQGGKTIAWERPGRVEFDGELLSTDTSKMNGFYYEASIPVQNFASQHRISLTDNNKKQYTEEFSFSPFSLKTEIPLVINRNELVIKLNGLDSGATVRLLLTDTSFFSRGIDRIDTVIYDSIVITPRDFESLKNGPIYLEIHKDEEHPLKEPGKAGGTLFTSYSLKRAFELVD